MYNKGLYLIGKNRFELREENKSFEVGPHEVLLRIKACGVCGSDLTYAKTCNHSPDNAIILGHEFTGVVEILGGSIKNLKINDKVVCEAGMNCGKCEHCLSGNHNLCQNIKFHGYSIYDGGFQERLVFPEDFCLKIPNNLDMITATLAEPLAVCLHSLYLSKFKLGMDAAVIGCGPIGLILVNLLKHAGANKIFVCEPQKARRELAIQYGANFSVDPTQEDFISMVMSHTHSLGVDRVFEAAGKHESIRLTSNVAKAGAHLIMIGIPSTDRFDISHEEVRKKGLTIKMVRRFKNTLPMAIKMLADGYGLTDIITHTFTLDDAERIFKLNQRYEDNIIKSVLVFSDD
ncbi:MAG: alcohol dehydrogenase catalytic domain-containing protein [Candidatus Methanoperedens sp.]|nr:alcohol dehydrogenase catalytic domain-containing protein [Candidatus Methanoperedens sp.]